MQTEVLDQFNLSEQEKTFLSESKTGITSDMNQSKIISDIYFIKNLEILVNKTIASNEKLAESNARYSKGMLWLTGALVFVGLVQIATIFIG